MAIKSILFIAGLAALATAQTTSTVVASSTQSQAMPPAATQGFNINNVTASEKSDWCLSQTHTCRDICGGSTEYNSCDNNALTYSCICPNGTAPDVTRYQGSLPYLICLRTFAQCMDAHPNDSIGQGVCQQNENFCVEDTTNLVSTATATGTSASTTGGTSATTSSGGSATSSAATSSSSGSATTNTVASGAFAAMIFAVFEMVL